MRHHRKKSQASEYTEADGRPRSLTPAERLVLSAFGDGDDRTHDPLTIAGVLNGGRCFPRQVHRACERLAEAVLPALVAMKYITRDANGWHRLAEQPAAAVAPPINAGGQS